MLSNSHAANQDHKLRRLGIRDRFEVLVCSAELGCAKPAPEAFDAVMADVESIVAPALTHWQHPNFFAFFPANSSYPAILGDLLSTGLGINGMGWATSPA